MDKSTLFSIGEFSQITGATIKALHYYEKINILNPMWIDKSSGYRYYGIQQIPIVEVIELLLDLDIRLNQLPEFVTNDFTNINYEKILQHGKLLTSNKIQELKNKMRYIDYLEETLNTTQFPTRSYSGIPLWLMPYDKTNSDLSMTDALKMILQDIHPYGLKFRNSYGRMMFCNGKEQRIYYFIDLKMPAQRRILHENIFYLPEGKYRTASQSNSKLEEAKSIFKDLFSVSYDKIVIEADHSLYCLLPDEDT